MGGLRDKLQKSLQPAIDCIISLALRLAVIEVYWPCKKTNQEDKLIKDSRDIHVKK
jgi:hypothetical protein